MVMVWVWAIVIAVSLVAEFLSMQMISIWLALGGVVGLILAVIGGISIEIQIVIMVIISLLSIIFLRKFALKYLNNTSEDKKAEVLIGKTGKVLDDITKNNNGTVKISGVIWTACAEKELTKGEEVEVIEVNGNKLKVKKIVIKKGE